MFSIPRVFRVLVTTVLAALLWIALPEARPVCAAPASPAGWFLAGNSPADYTIGTDVGSAHGGKESAFLAAKGSGSKGFGTLMQEFVPKEFVGKRVRLSAWVKSESVGDWAGVWMRVDGPAGRSLAFDNMQTRPIKGTSDWKRYDVVLDVPAEA